MFSPSDYPDVPEELLQRLTEEFDELFTALAQVSTRAVSSGSFTSAASGTSSLSLRNPLGAKPSHVTVALRRDDLADFSAAWSWWWQASGDQILVKFVGLPASIKHVYSVEFS